MEENTEYEEDDPVGEDAPQEDSLLASLREKRQQIAKDKHLDLEIPGYDGLLWARYHSLSWDDLKRIAEKAGKSRSPRKELLAHMDTLIEACDQIMIRKDKKLEPLNNAYPEFGTEPVVFDNRLGAALGFESDSARSTVMKAFGGNGVAITAQQNDLVEWIQSSRSEEDEDF